MLKRPESMGIVPFARVAVFVDGAHFEYIRRGAKLQWQFSDEIDWGNLLHELTENAQLLRAYYYAGEWTDDAIRDQVEYLRRANTPEEKVKEEEESLKRLKYAQAGFWRYLSRNGFQIRKKPVRVFYTGARKADLDLELAIDMLTLADRCDTFILVSGDSDFIPLVGAVGLRGVRVIVAATQELSNPRAADDLLDAADAFIELKTIWRDIERQKK